MVICRHVVVVVVVATMVVAVFMGYVVVDVLFSLSIIVVGGPWAVMVSCVTRMEASTHLYLNGDDACHHHHHGHVVFLLVQLLRLVMWHCHIVTICWCVRCMLLVVDDGSGWLTMVVGVGGHRSGEAAAGRVIVEDGGG